MIRVEAKLSLMVLLTLGGCGSGDGRKSEPTSEDGGRGGQPAADVGAGAMDCAPEAGEWTFASSAEGFGVSDYWETMLSPLRTTFMHDAAAGTIVATVDLSRRPSMPSGEEYRAFQFMYTVPGPAETSGDLRSHTLRGRIRLVSGGDPESCPIEAYAWALGKSDYSAYGQSETLAPLSESDGWVSVEYPLDGLGQEGASDVKQFGLGISVSASCSGLTSEAPVVLMADDIRLDHDC